MNVGFRFALCILAVVVASSCSSSSSDPDTTDGALLSSIEWAGCANNNLQCADLDVPLNYSDPDGETIAIGLIRKPATEPDNAESLLLIPGGPGGSGVDAMPGIIEFGSIPDSIKSAYNVLTFDPRGIGSSSPVDCTEFDAESLAGFPFDDAGINALHLQLSSAAAECSEKVGEYLQHLGSINVVRDLDEMRRALGEEKLNAIGYSYGTRVAALYLQTFPQNSGRMVLDASMSPDAAVEGLIRDLLPLRQSVLRSVIARCGDDDIACDAGSLIGILNQRYSALRNEATMEARFEYELLQAIVQFTVDEPQFADLATQPLYDYLNSPDVTVLTDFADVLDQLVGFDIYEEINDAGEAPAFSAVMCADDSSRPTPDGLIQTLGEFNQISDLFVVERSLFALCSGWPVALEPLMPIATDSAPLSLVIGGTTDTVTPISWSQDMAPAIGGFLLTSDHPGHTAVFFDESDCVDEVVETFLLNGLPPQRTECIQSQ